MLADPYPVKPWSAPCRGEVRLPGSKSLTNRALLVAAMCDSSVRLRGALFSRDTQILCDGLRTLGFIVDEYPEDESMVINGLGGRIPHARAQLNVGNAGTAARFLTAFVCLHPDGLFLFDGDEEMRIRPMRGLLEGLESLGAQFQFHGEPGCFPFQVKTSGLNGGRWDVDASASSQMLSALMLAAPMASGKVTLHASGARPAFVEMTAGLMRQFGIAITGSAEQGYVVAEGQHYQAPDSREFWIEPDATAASYFMMLPYVVGGTLKIRGMREGMLQGDTAFARVLESVGMQVVDDAQGWIVCYTDPQPLPLLEADFQTFSDTFLTLAAAGPLLPFPVRISGIAHTRHQETDRIYAVTTELQRIGAPVSSGEDYIETSPAGGGFVPPDGLVVQTYKDHRVAMAFAILGCSPKFGDRQAWLSITDPACCGKTFPRFFEVLESLYQNSHDK